MGEVNNIDDLFKAKLGARQVPYSPAAWSGAEAMLNQHYKWLLVKKAAVILTPLLVGATALGIFVLAPQSDETFEFNALQNGIHQSGIQPYLSLDTSATSNAAFVADDGNDRHTKKETRENTNDAWAQAGATNNASSESAYTPSIVGQHARPASVNDGVDKTMVNATSTDKTVQSYGNNRQSSMDEKPIANESPQDRASASIALPPDLAGMLDDLMLEPTAESVQATPVEHNSVSTEFAKLRLGNTLDKMPLGATSLGMAGTSHTLHTSSERPTAPSFNKVQLFAQFGLLAGRGFHDLDGNRQSPALGAWAQLDGKYHLNQSVYLNAAAGWFSRGSLAASKPFQGNDGTTIEVLPRQANYLHFLLGTGYRITARHSIGIGMAVSPMVGVWSQKRVTDADGATSNTSVIDNTGMANLDAAFSINHQFSLAERLDLSTALQFGLFDQTNNNTFGTGAISDYNTLLKIGLSYRFTNR